MKPVKTLPSRMSGTSPRGLSVSGLAGSGILCSSGLDWVPTSAVLPLEPFLLRFLRDEGRTQRKAT